MTEIVKCLICSSKTKRFISRLYDDRYGSPGKYDIYRCRRCGFGRTAPSLDRKRISRFYSEYYPLSNLDKQEVISRARIVPKISAWFAGIDNTAHRYIKLGSTVLDIGSGSGQSLLEIEALGGVAHGIEPDPNAQKIARSLKLKVYKGFITDNPFPNKKFDFITASQVIEHEPNPKEFLEAVKKKLNKGGMVILSFPTSDAFYRKIFGKKWIHWHVPYHINHFTRKSINILAKEVGFEVVRTRSVTPNLWTMLQLRVLFNRPAEGAPNSVWVPRTRTTRRSKERSLIRRLVITSLKYLMIPIAILNRTLDTFGQGESLLVFLKKGKNENKK